MIVKNKVEKVVRPELQEPWSNRMRKTLAKLREGAKGHSEKEIEQIVDEAVKAVRREEKHKKKAA